MSIPSSGPISLSMLQAEFGGPIPAKLSNYYRGGAYVPNTSHNTSIPTSGPISLSNFYGSSHNQQPVWNTASGSLGSTMEGEPVSTSVSATDPDSYPSTLTYSIISGSVPPGLSFNTSTGAITGTLTPNLIGSTTAYPFTIRASDGDLFADRAFSYTVVYDTAPTWSTPSGELGPQHMGTGFSKQLVVNDPDGPNTLAFSIISGSLPPGLGMSGSGLISGTLPIANQAYSFTVQVTDGVKQSSQSFQITVTDTAPTWSGVPNPLYSGTVGDSISIAMSSYAHDSDGDGLSYSIVSGSPPSGTSMDGAGNISGTLTTAGTYNFTVRVSDGLLTADQACEIDAVHVTGFNEWTSSGDWTVPSGVSTLTLTWLIGGAGGGGTGGSGGNNGAGGGGGSGGWYSTSDGITIAVSAGDTIHVDIGTGGPGGPFNSSVSSGTPGTAGGNTVIYKNGTPLYTAFGGNGGGNGDNGVGGSAGTTGGPNGNNGAAGTAGTSNTDIVNPVAGVGGAGPMPGATGGAGGTNSSPGNVSSAGAGQNGTGYGSGGGGGGVVEFGTGHGAGAQAGGAGQQGYARIDY